MLHFRDSPVRTIALQSRFLTRAPPQRPFPGMTIAAIGVELKGGRVAIFPNNRRALLAFAHDVLMAALSLVASLYLRLGGEGVDYRPQLTATYIIGFTLIAAIVFLLTGLYRGIWRYASLPDLFNIA